MKGSTKMESTERDEAIRTVTEATSHRGADGQVPAAVAPISVPRFHRENGAKTTARTVRRTRANPSEQRRTLSALFFRWI